MSYITLPAGEEIKHAGLPVYIKDGKVYNSPMQTFVEIEPGKVITMQEAMDTDQPIVIDNSAK